MSLRKFLTTEIIASAFINGLLGALFGWLITRGSTTVPFSGPGGIAIDVLVTAFLIGVLLTLIVTPIMRARIQKGGMPEVTKLPKLMALLPQNAILRSVIMGLGGGIVIAPIVLALFWLTGTTQLSPGQFIWIKGLYSALFGAVFTPFALLPMLAGKIK